MAKATVAVMNELNRVVPMHDRVLVLPDEPERVSRGGIHIPDAAKGKTTRGKVVRVGPGKAMDDGTIRPLPVKVGDVIMYTKYAGTDHALDGTEYKLLHETEILAKIPAE